MFFSDDFLVRSLTNQRSKFLIRLSLWGPATCLVVDVLKKIHCVVCSDISMTWEANLCCLQRNIERITNEPEDICVTCAIWSYLNCAMKMTIFVKMCFRCQWDCQVYSTLKEGKRGKEMKISEIDGFFIHFVIKEAPQNCENVYRKYHVSNYVPSRQKLC